MIIIILLPLVFILLTTDRRAHREVSPLIISKFVSLCRFCVLDFFNQDKCGLKPYYSIWTMVVVYEKRYLEDVHLFIVKRKCWRA